MGDSTLTLLVFLLLLSGLIWLLLLPVVIGIQKARNIARWKIKNLSQPVTFWVKIQNREFVEEFEDMCMRMLRDGVITEFSRTFPKE